MIDHITIKVSKLETSLVFYEETFKSLGYTIAFGEKDNFYAFNIGKGCLFEIAQEKTQQKPTSVHIAFRVYSEQEVNNFYKLAIKAGAVDNGAPGLRPQYTENYYACFVLDPDGHNIEAVYDKQNNK